MDSTRRTVLAAGAAAAARPPCRAFAQQSGETGPGKFYNRWFGGSLAGGIDA